MAVAFTLQLLRNEIDAGHPSTGAYSRNDGVAANEINAVNRTKQGEISSRALLLWSAFGSRYKNIKDAADNNTRADHSAASAALTMLTREDTALDMGDPVIIGFIDSMIANGVLTAADKASLEGLAASETSRAGELWTDKSRVTPSEIANARRLP